MLTRTRIFAECSRYARHRVLRIYGSYTSISKLVLRIPDGLGELKNLLERHITNLGLAAIEKLGNSAQNDPKIYVNTILEVHRKYSALVLTAFDNNAGFVASLDKACGEFDGIVLFLDINASLSQGNLSTTTP